MNLDEKLPGLFAVGMVDKSELDKLIMPYFTNSLQDALNVINSFLNDMGFESANIQELLKAINTNELTAFNIGEEKPHYLVFGTEEQIKKDIKELVYMEPEEL